jgi:hypothetical protein
MPALPKQKFYPDDPTELRACLEASIRELRGLYDSEDDALGQVLARAIACQEQVLLLADTAESVIGDAINDGETETGGDSCHERLFNVLESLFAPACTCAEPSIGTTQICQRCGQRFHRPVDLDYVDAEPCEKCDEFECSGATGGECQAHCCSASDYPEGGECPDCGLVRQPPPG